MHRCIERGHGFHSPHSLELQIHLIRDPFSLFDEMRQFDVIPDGNYAPWQKMCLSATNFGIDRENFLMWEKLK